MLSSVTQSGVAESPMVFLFAATLKGDGLFLCVHTTTLGPKTTCLQNNMASGRAGRPIVETPGCLMYHSFQQQITNLDLLT